MSAALFFEHPLWSRLAVMHWHFLWQGLLIACLYWAVVRLFNVTSARLRYVLGMGGLAAMMLATFATFWLADVPKPSTEPSSQYATREQEPPSPSLLPLREKGAEGRMKGNGAQESHPSIVPLTLSPQERGDKTVSPAPPSYSEQTQDLSQTQTSQSPLVPILLGGWFLGVMIFGLRLLAGVGTVVWWRWSSTSVMDAYWIELVQRLSRELGLAHPPRLAVSQRAEDAFSLGLFRPVIVLPAAWILKLPPEALEHILAHELSHIRRFDAWANLFQRVLEAWLFYHPAVWWLSKQMDEEREKCADLKAVSLTGDRLRYVKTLAGIAEYQAAARKAKSNGPILATGMGGKNMVLLERVRHVLGQTPRTGAASRFLAGTMVLAIPMALWVGTMMLPANAQESDAAIAQADEDKERGDRKEGDKERPDGERRDGDRPREDGERRDGERREGDRPRAEGERRDGDRPRPEGERRDGDRPRAEGERRDGDRPRPEGERRDGDRPRGEEGRPPVFPPRGLPGGPMPPRFRDGEGGPAGQGELIELIRELRREVEQLRQEVRQLREGGSGESRSEFGPGRGGSRPGPDARPGGGTGFRPGFRRPDGERREGDRPDGDRRDGDRPDVRRPEGDRPDARRPEGEADRPRDGERRVEERERDETRERLEEARETEREKERPDGEGKDNKPERESDDD